MADAVLGSVTNALDIVFKIKHAVDTVKQNEKECQKIKRRVERVGHTLSLCQKDAELMNPEGSGTALEALHEILAEALELVTGCQEETNMCCLLLKAGEVSKQLNQVDQNISCINSEVSLAIMVCIAPHTKPLVRLVSPCIVHNLFIGISFDVIMNNAYIAEGWSLSNRNSTKYRMDMAVRSNWYYGLNLCTLYKFLQLYYIIYILVI